MKHAVKATLHRVANLPRVRKVVTDWRPVSRAYFELRFARGDAYSPPQDVKREKIETAFGLARARDLKARHALELGCGSGRCVSALQGISERVLETDIAWNATRQARQREHDASRVTFRVADLLTDPFPEAPFDLILCSDVLYYMRRDQLAAVTSRLVDLLEPNGHLLAVHDRVEGDEGTGMMEFKAFGARTVHDTLAAHSALTVIADQERPSFRATLFHRGDPGQPAPSQTAT